MEELRQLPYSIESEQYILASALINPQEASAIVNSVHSEHFYDVRHKNIMEAMEKLYQNHQEINYTNVIEELKREKKFEASGGIDYIGYLIDILPTYVRWDTYVTNIKEKALQRELYHTLSNLSNDILSGRFQTDDILNNTERLVKNVLNKRSVNQLTKVDSITPGVIDEINKRMQNKNDLIGIDTGFKELNNILSGFKKQELIILAARPGVGKTALALNFASAACKQGKYVAFISLEMGKEQIVKRLISTESAVDHDKINKGQLSATEISSILTAKSQTIDKFNLYLDDSNSANIFDIMAQCRSLKRNGKLDMIVVDYLQLIDLDNPRRSSTRAEIVGAISRSLKVLAMELDIPIIALSQLNRTAAKPDGEPNLAQLRESGSIEQDADVVMFIYSNKEDEERNQKTANLKLKVEKNRHGRTGIMDITFFKHILKFTQEKEQR